jgi:hypothetical protein
MRSSARRKGEKVDKETFDTKVAAIWSIYNAATTLNAAGCSTRVLNEQTAAALRKVTGELGEALANVLETRQQAA